MIPALLTIALVCGSADAPTVEKPPVAYTIPEGTKLTLPSGKERLIPKGRYLSEDLFQQQTIAPPTKDDHAFLTGYLVGIATGFVVSLTVVVLLSK